MKTYRFSEFSLMVYPNKDIYTIKFPTTIKVFNYQLLLSVDDEFFVYYDWDVECYVDKCFLRTGYISHKELMELWDKQTDKDERLTEIFWKFVNS